MSLRQRAGYRGRVLGYLGATWITIGAGVAQGFMPHAAGFVTWTNIAAAAWIITGTLALAGALTIQDRAFYGILAFAPACAAVASAANWIIALVPGPPPGAPGGFAATALYAALAAFVWLQNGVKEPGTETVSPEATAKFLSDKDNSA